MGSRLYLHPKEGDAGEQIHRGLEILQPFRTAGREVVLPKGKKRAELHPELLQGGERRGRKQPPVVSDLIRQVGKLRLGGRLTRYMERSIRKELCSWSRSLTNRSFCGETPRNQVNGGKATGTAPPPHCPCLSLPPSPARATPPPHPSPSCCPAVLPSLLPSPQPCGRARDARGEERVLAGGQGLVAAIDGSRGTCGRAGHGAGSRGNIPFPLTGGLCRNGDGLLYLPLFARTPPSLSSGQERGEGVQDCAPRPHGPWAEALEELRKKGLSQRSPIFGAELLPDKARNGPQESDASRGSPLA